VPRHPRRVLDRRSGVDFRQRPLCQHQIPDVLDIHQDAWVVVDGSVARKAGGGWSHGVAGAQELLTARRACILQRSRSGLARSLSKYEVVVSDVEHIVVLVEEGGGRVAEDPIVCRVDINCSLVVGALGSVKSALVSVGGLDHQLDVNPAVEGELWGREVFEMQFVQLDVEHRAHPLEFVEMRNVVHHFSLDDSLDGLGRHELDRGARQGVRQRPQLASVHLVVGDACETEAKCLAVWEPCKEGAVRKEGRGEAVFDGLRHKVVENALDRGLGDKRVASNDGAHEHEEAQLNARRKIIAAPIGKALRRYIVGILVLGDERGIGLVPTVHKMCAFLVVLFAHVGDVAAQTRQEVIPRLEAYTARDPAKLGERNARVHVAVYHDAELLGRTTHDARTCTLMPNKSVTLSASACQVSLH